MKVKNKKIYLALLSAIFALSVNFVVNAQTTDPVEQREVELRAELEKNLAEQEKIKSFLSEKQKEGGSIERDIAILSAQIEEARLIIREKNILIERLGKDINIKTSTIDNLDDKIESGKESLGILIRKTNQIDDYTLLEAVLSSQSISAFFEDIDSFHAIKTSMHETFEDIRNTRNLTETEKQNLTTKKNKEVDARAIIESERRKIESKEDEKQRLLALNKQEQNAYETELKTREKRAAEIRSALFALRDSAPIPFGDAYQYAKEAERSTGVRPAFLLAILTQESNLGQNVGTCNRPGDPADKTWKHIMPGPVHYANYVANGRSCGAGAASPCSWRDDQGKFEEITSNLGLDPNVMPLSCPLSSSSWGGAMGPSQFIPSTWDSYADRLSGYLGVSYPDPWNPRHAFMASATYLANLGAGAGGYTAERTAALKYYAGGNWSKPQNAFYGNSVMDHAADIQNNMIDPLQGL